MRAAPALALTVLLAQGCGSPPKVGAPLRPTAAPREVDVSVPPHPDCLAWDGSRAPPPVTPSAVARTEAEQLAVAATAAYRRLVAMTDDDVAVRYALVLEISKQAIDSLGRDPYNPRAAVVLAIVYGYLGRGTCRKNLVDRALAEPGGQQIHDELVP